MTNERRNQVLNILVNRIENTEFWSYKTNKELAEKYQVTEGMIKKAKSIIIEKEVLKELQA